MSLKNQPGADEEEIKVSKSLLCLCRIHKRFIPRNSEKGKPVGFFVYFLFACLFSFRDLLSYRKVYDFFCGPNPYMIVLPEICLFFPQIKILKNIEAP